jgi:hypothetical protein
LFFAPFFYFLGAFCNFLGKGFFVFGGDSKEILGMRLTGETVEKVYQIESKRKIFKLVRLDKNTVLVGDSAGGVKSFDWRAEADKKLNDLFAHFAQLTALTVIGHFIVSAGCDFSFFCCFSSLFLCLDMDFQVRVCKRSHPREITAFLMGFQSPVFSIFRGKHDFEIFCVDNEKNIRKYHIVNDAAQEVDAFQDAIQPQVAVQNQVKKSKTGEDEQ